MLGKMREAQEGARGTLISQDRWSGSEHLRVKCHKDYTTWWCTGDQYHLVGKLTYRTIEVSHVVRPNECVCVIMTVYVIIMHAEG